MTMGMRQRRCSRCKKRRRFAGAPSRCPHGGPTPCKACRDTWVCQVCIQRTPGRVIFPALELRYYGCIDHSVPIVHGHWMQEHAVDAIKHDSGWWTVLFGCECCWPASVLPANGRNSLEYIGSTDGSPGRWELTQAVQMTPAGSPPTRASEWAVRNATGK